MRNCDQCAQGLLYNSFSVILFQTFTVGQPTLIDTEKYENYVKAIDSEDDNIDNQIFTHREQIVQRYKLPSFEVDIVVDERKQDLGKPADFVAATLKGRVLVQAAIFFDTTVQISYRIVVDRDNDDSPCRTNRSIDTNELIALASMAQQSEHWSLNEKNVQTIGQNLESINISQLQILPDSRFGQASGHEDIDLNEVFRRHHNFFEDSYKIGDTVTDHNYTLVDIWENFGHQDSQTDFTQMSEDHIIEHIELHHKSELIGLMSFYPDEWPYRLDRSFEEICGRNIAIDTDDLVLANQNVCVVFGTYGKRGEESQTDWNEHLKTRNNYNTSWPEYMAILELLLVQKQTINYALGQYIRNSDKINYKSTPELIDKIDNNAALCIDISNRLLKLNAMHYLRFISHKHMYEMTSKSLKIDDDKSRLNDAISSIDNALINANNVIEARQAEKSKNLLYFISIASLFGILLESDQIPMITRLYGQDNGVLVAGILEGITVLAIFVGLYLFIHSLYESRRNKKINKLQL